MIRLIVPFGIVNPPSNALDRLQYYNTITLKATAAPIPILCGQWLDDNGKAADYSIEQSGQLVPLNIQKFVD